MKRKVTICYSKQKQEINILDQMATWPVILQLSEKQCGGTTKLLQSLCSTQLLLMLG